MPETRSGRSGPDLKARKKNPAKLAVGVVAVVVIAVGVGWGLTHLAKAPQGPGGPGGPGGAAGPGGPGGGRGGRGGRFGGRAAITVGTAPAKIGAIPIQLDALGTVTPPVTATITSRVAGNLMEVYFTEGQTVKKGQKLALIDPRPFQVALQQAEGTLARDQAALANSRVDLQRYQTLLAQNSIASQQVDTQAALVKQNEAVVKTDQAAVANARLNLTYTSITAPVSGRVGLRLVDVGNYVPAGSTTGLVVLTQVDPIDVVFTVPEDNLPQIVRRQHSGANLPVTVFNRGGSDALAQGKLSTLDNQIDVATGTVKAKARFDNAAGTLFPNQFVNARMLVDVLCNVVVAPTTAVRHGSQGDYVFVLQPDRTAKMVMVTTGAGAGETVAITKGLQGGETVITEGGDRLRDGSQVNLPGDRPQGGSGFSGGRRGRRSAGQGGPGQGAALQGAPGAGSQGGQAGGFRSRRGGKQGSQGVAAADTETRGTQAQGIPVAQVPPGACPAPGGRRLAAGQHGPAGAPGGQGPQDAGRTADQGAPPEGAQRRRFGPGGPGEGGFRRRQGGEQSAGQGQAG